MKKVIRIFLSLCLIMSFTTGAKAMEYMLGAKSGYYAWQPFLKEMGGSGMSDMEWGTGVLYGPIASLIFTPDISFSVAGLMGEQSTHWQSTFSDFDSNRKITGTYYFEAFRADIDSALSYRMSQNFKIFAGYKYQYLDMTYRYTEIRTDLSNQISEVYVSLMDHMKGNLHGPALGLGFSIPLGMKYFFAANISGLYMWGNTQTKNKAYHMVGDDLVPDPDQTYSNTLKLKQYGLNFEPSVGFSAGEGLPIISLGFRYQRFWAKYYNTPDSMEIPNKYFHDTLIGGFVSAVFMF